MRCPYCDTDDSRVVDSRTVDDGIRRRRECLGCSARYTTYERVELAALLVVKRDGRREPFSHEKLLAGLRRACEKRPLEASTVEALAAAVEHEVSARNTAEVPSTLIGELVMERLKRLDQIAYVRFASVYRHFTDLDSLREVLDELDSTCLHTAPDNPLTLIAGESGGHQESTRIVPLHRARRRKRRAR